MDGERIIAVVPGARRRTWNSNQVWTLVVTDLRIIAAAVDDKAERPSDKVTRENGRWAHSDSFVAERDGHISTAERYWAMEPDAIAAESPNNLIYERNSIRSIEISRHFYGSYVPFLDLGGPRLRIKIQTASNWSPGAGTRADHETTVFDTESELPALDDARRLFREAFGSVVR